MISRKILQAEEESSNLHLHAQNYVHIVEITEILCYTFLAKIS